MALNFQNIEAAIKGVSLSDKIVFTKNLTLIIKAGMSLPQGLETLSRQTTSRALALATNDIRDAVNKGKNFSEALGAHPRIFDTFFVNVVKTGEASGNLDEVLEDLSAHMEKEKALRSRILSALMYPSVIFFVMVTVIILMMILVVPELAKVFADFRVELPKTTQFVIFASNLFANYFLVVLSVLLILVSAFWYGVKKTGPGKRALDWVILHMPVIGSLSKKINSARLARSLQTLIRAGVPIIQALDITSQVVKNSFYRQSLKETAKEIERGKQLHEILERYTLLFPPLVTELIAVGEETGSVEKILGELASSYEADVDKTTKNLPSIIEPLLMVFIGGTVGFFAVSMLQPIYTLSSSINF